MFKRKLVLVLLVFAVLFVFKINSYAAVQTLEVWSGQETTFYNPRQLLLDNILGTKSFIVKGVRVTSFVENSSGAEYYIKLGDGQGKTYYSNYNNTTADYFDIDYTFVNEESELLIGFTGDGNIGAVELDYELIQVLDVPNVNIDSVADNEINISWNSVPNAMSYEVYLDDVLQSTIADTTYSFSSLQANTAYEIKVVAKADSYYDSQYVDTVTTSKLAFENLDINVIADTTNIYVTCDNASVESYDVYLDDVLQGNTIDGNYQINDLIPNSTYSVKVIAKAINYDDYIYTKSVDTVPLQPCKFNLINSLITYNSIKLNYSADNSETIQYYLDDVLIEEITASDQISYTYIDLDPETDYTVKIVVSAQYRDSVEYVNVFTTSELVVGSLNLVNVNRSSKLDENDTVEFIFTNFIQTFTVNSISNYDSYVIDGKKVSVKLNNLDESVVDMDFSVTDVFGQDMNVVRNFITDKGGIWMTFDFSFITGWVTDLVGAATTASQTILLAGLGLLGLIIGSFFLIGLGKKSVKKAK